MAIADLSDVWVVADLFENDVGALETGDRGEGHRRRHDRGRRPDRSGLGGGRSRSAHRAGAREAGEPRGTLRPNAYAQIKFFDPTPAKVALPSSAVMSDGAETYVYVKDKSGALKKRTVVVGSASGGKVPILEGLEPGEQVVVQGAILLDNQIQLDN